MEQVARLQQALRAQQIPVELAAELGLPVDTRQTESTALASGSAAAAYRSLVEAVEVEEEDGEEPDAEIEDSIT